MKPCPTKAAIILAAALFAATHGQSEAEREHFLRIAKRQNEQAEFRDGLKKLELVFKRSCIMDRNMILDMSCHRMEFLSSAGRYARLRVNYHAPYNVDYAPALTITGDPAGQDTLLKTSSIDDFMRQTDGLALIQRKIADLIAKVGPVVKAEDDKAGCGDDDWSPVPIEVR